MDNYLKINNNELQKILNFIKDEPIFYETEKKLLSKSEILNYKEELQTEFEMIPLIDLYDNNFLIYNLKENKFQLFDISEDMPWKDIETINDYLVSIEQSIK